MTLLVSALLLLYARTGSYGYIDFDDTASLQDNLTVQRGLTMEGIRWAFTSFYAANWHPLTWMSHMADVSLFGMDPGAHHLVNVFLHGVVSLLVYALTIELLARRDAALAAALLFLVHPQHVESVAWLAERKDLLCALFYLAAILAYSRYSRAPSALRMTAVMVLYVLALLSKPMAVTLPVILLVLDAWPLARASNAGNSMALRWWPLLREKIPFLPVTLGACVVTVAAQSQSGAVAGLAAMQLTDRLINALVSYGLYLRDFLVPSRLGVFYPLGSINFFTELLPAAAALIGTFGVGLWMRRRHPGLLAGCMWFLITLLPVIGLVQVGSQARADRYMYIPSVGLLLGLVSVLPAATAHARRIGLTAVALAAGFWGFLCYLQVGYWESPEALYKRTAEVTRDNVFAETRLLDLLIARGDLASASERARSLVVRFPGRYEGYMSMGGIALASGNPAEAERWFRAAEERAPAHWHVLNDLGIAVLRQARKTEGCEILERALSMGGPSALLEKNLLAGDCTR
ncbi:MAG: tetratricopeptide repeat protein [Gammaproteobacteria bacterium]